MTISNTELAEKISNLVNKWGIREDEMVAWLGGVAGGGPNSDGKYPLTDLMGNTVNVTCPAQLEADVSGTVDSALQYANDALASANAASTSEANAANSATTASNAETKALEYRDASQAAAQDSQTHRDSSRDWASASVGFEVEPGKYSSYHYSQQAATSASEASASETNVLDAEANVELLHDSFQDKWQGVYTSPPTTRPDGTALQEGDAYIDGNTGYVNIYFSGTWEAFSDYTRRTSVTGSAKVPVGTQAQRDGTPAKGYFRFNDDTKQFEGFNGSAWGAVGAGAKGAGGDQVFVENDQTVNNDYTIPADKNAMTTGPVSIANGVTVTVETGARWVVI